MASVLLRRVCTKSPQFVHCRGIVSAVRSGGVQNSQFKPDSGTRKPKINQLKNVGYVQTRQLAHAIVGSGRFQDFDLAGRVYVVTGERTP